MNKRKWTAWMFAAVVAAAGVFAGCGSDSDSTGADESTATVEESADSAEETAESSELKTLRIGVGGTDDTMVMEIGSLAYANGYLEEELNAVGYTAEFYAFTNTGPEVNEAIAAGDLDGAIYGDFPAFTSKSNGIDTTIVATVNQRMQYSLLTATGEITSASDLEGHSVVVIQGTVQQYFWEKYIEATGIDESAVEIINSSDASSLLQTGSADAAACNRYLAYYYLESLEDGAVVDNGSNYDIFTTSVLTLTDSILEEAPEVAVALNKALIRAYEDATADPEALYAAVATTYMSEEVMKTAYDFDESLWYMSPEIADDTLEYYEELSTWLYENGLIQSTVDVSSFIDTQYYEQAAEELSAE